MALEMNQEQIDWFWSRVGRPRAKSKCWNWPGSCDSKGYGLCHKKIDGKLERKAYRASYKIFKGNIPHNKEIDHTCNNTSCVNYHHLRLATRKQNVLRGAGPTAVNARKNKCIRGHKFTVKNTRLHKGKYGVQRVCRTCHREKEKARYHDRN